MYIYTQHKSIFVFKCLAQKPTCKKLVFIFFLIHIGNCFSTKWYTTHKVTPWFWNLKKKSSHDWETNSTKLSKCTHLIFVCTCVCVWVCMWMRNNNNRIKCKWTHNKLKKKKKLYARSNVWKTEEEGTFVWKGHTQTTSCGTHTHTHAHDWDHCANVIHIDC